jgi:hypothetical protein
MRNRAVNEQSLALAREWKRLGRAATAVALLTSPIVFAVTFQQAQDAKMYLMLEFAKVP